MLPISPKDIKFLVTAAESLNPFAYTHLKHRHFMENFSYITSLVFVCLFISALAYLPAIASIEPKVAEEMQKFEKLGISYEAEAEKTIDVSLFGINAVRIGGTEERGGKAEGKGRALLSIGSEGITSRHALCAGLSVLCGIYPDSFTSSEDLKDLSDNGKGLAGFVRMAVLLSLPGILIVALIFYTAKYLAAALAFTLIGFIATKILRFEINLNSIFAISIYSSTILVVPDMLGSSFGIELLGINWALFAAMFTAGVLLSAKKAEGDKHGHRGSAENKHAGKGAS
ncbi:DUF1189 family protein [Candidatus Woesearchaeota archaeon]|nr:DUF1189 family protein [Candidatus Woesearchaeota archaeon]